MTRDAPRIVRDAIELHVLSTALGVAHHAPTVSCSCCFFVCCTACPCLCVFVNPAQACELAYHPTTISNDENDDVGAVKAVTYHIRMHHAFIYGSEAILSAAAAAAAALASTLAHALARAVPTVRSLSLCIIMPCLPCPLPLA